MTRFKARMISRIFGQLFVFDFLAFLITSVLLGGTAGNGHVLNGHYFVGDHGRYREVGRGVFYFSLVQGVSVFVAAFIALAAQWWLRRHPDGEP